jgi:hypothetical protein
MIVLGLTLRLYFVSTEESKVLVWNKDTSPFQFLNTCFTASGDFIALVIILTCQPDNVIDRTYFTNLGCKYWWLKRLFKALASDMVVFGAELGLGLGSESSTSHCHFTDHV